MIKETFDSFVRSAKGLGDYQAMSKTELANGYCDADDANDPIKRDQYFSALILRYWFKVKEFAQHSQFARLELDDFVSWVSESLIIAFKYRRWRDPSHPLSKDPDGPQKVFNQALFSTQKRWLTHLNKNKRRVNYIAESIEEHIEIFGEKAQSLTQHYTEIELTGPSEGIVQRFLNNGSIADALIIDTIAHQDSFVKATKKRNYLFDRTRVYTNLNKTTSAYLDYFKNTYDVNHDELSNVVKELNSLSKKEIYKRINSAMSKVKNNKALFEMLKESFH
jgi:hypothetical protein